MKVIVVHYYHERQQTYHLFGIFADSDTADREMAKYPNVEFDIESWDINDCLILRIGVEI